MAHFRRWAGYMCWVLGLGISSIAVAQIPPNDNFTNAIPLYGSSVTFTGSLVNATAEAGEPREANFFIFGWEAGSVWWKWTATNTSSVVVRSLARVTVWR